MKKKECSSALTQKFNHTIFPFHLLLTTKFLILPLPYRKRRWCWGWWEKSVYNMLIIISSLLSDASTIKCCRALRGSENKKVNFLRAQLVCAIYIKKENWQYTQPTKHKHLKASEIFLSSGNIVHRYGEACFIFTSSPSVSHSLIRQVPSSCLVLQNCTLSLFYFCCC